MEFGTLIPLFYMTMCAIIAIWVVGTGLVVALVFRVKNQQLTRNVLLTVAVISTIWFLYPLALSAYRLLLMCRYCPEDNFRITSGVFLSTLEFSTSTLFFSVPCGYLIAFGLVAPVTLAIRARQERKTANPVPSA